MSIRQPTTAFLGKQAGWIVGLMMISAATLAVDHSAPGRLWEVDGHWMHLRCSGQGAPAVVLDSGLGGSTAEWALLQPLVAYYTTVCSYDRSGSGWSESSLRPRSSVHIAAELRELLRRAGVASPYILVGHSFGGFNMRIFAAAHPDEVAGLVLIDASHESQFERYKADFGVNLAPTRHGRIRLPPPWVPQAVPAAERAAALRRASIFSARLTIRDELLAFRRSAEEVRGTSTLPDVPLVVLTRGRHEWREQTRSAQMEGLWMELQRSLVRLTTDGQHIVAMRSGHYIHLDQPKLVDGAIEQMARRIRGARMGWNLLNRLGAEPG